MKKILIYGAGGHGKVVADIARLNGYEDIVFYDDNPTANENDGYMVVHNLQDYMDYDFVVALGNNELREKICKKYFNNLVTLIHPSAILAKNTVIKKGTVVMAGAVINSGTVIGEGNIINTCCSIDHDNNVGNYNHLSVNSHTAGAVTIGDRNTLGIGSNVINCVKIKSDCMIGAGAVVIRDIAEPGTYVGVPARKIK